MYKYIIYVQYVHIGCELGCIFNLEWILVYEICF